MKAVVVHSWLAIEKKIKKEEAQKKNDKEDKKRKKNSGEDEEAPDFQVFSQFFAFSCWLALISITICQHTSQAMDQYKRSNSKILILASYIKKISHYYVGTWKFFFRHVSIINLMIEVLSAEVLAGI